MSIHVLLTLCLVRLYTYSLRVEARMKKRYKDLRRRQIQQNMTGLQALRDSHRPPGGWLRTIRQSLKLTLPELAKKLGITKSTLIGFELREADDSITLAALKRVAEAMDCKLV